MSAWLRKLRKRFKKGKVSIQERYPHYKIGKATYGNPDVRSWNEGATLEIGSFCSIAEGVTIMLGCEHRAVSG